MNNSFAFIPIGGSGDSRHPACVRNVVVAGGYSEFAKQIGPILQDEGYTRLWIHNPGGLWPQFHPHDDRDRCEHIPRLTTRENRDRAAAIGYGDTRLMWIDQWLKAEQSKLTWASRYELSQFHLELTNDHGIEEIVYYFGGPYVARPEIQKESIKPFVCLPKVSFGFDHVIREPEFEACQGIFKAVRKMAPDARIYTEARPYEDIDKKLLKHVSGTVATAGFDAAHPVGSLPETQERARAIGEVIRIVDRDDGGNYPDPIDGVTFACRGALKS